MEFISPINISILYTGNIVIYREKSLICDNYYL